MLIHSFVWHRLPQMGPSGLFYPSSERDFHEFGVYYGLSELSVKAAAWNLMRKGEEEVWERRRPVAVWGVGEEGERFGWGVPQCQGVGEGRGT